MGLEPNRLTKAAETVWSHLQNRRLNGWEFLQRQKIDEVVVDFYCPECQLAVELDCALHALRPHEAEERRRVLEENEVRLIRFAVEAVCQDAVMVLDAIAQACFEQTGQVHAPGSAGSA